LFVQRLPLNRFCPVMIVEHAPPSSWFICWSEPTNWKEMVQEVILHVQGRVEGQENCNADTSANLCSRPIV
jgi:hypothetical protein